MRRALLCACSEYRDPAFAPLKFSLNDIEEIRRLLEEPALCGFEDVEVLANPGRSDAHEAVEHLTADCDQEDLILFYFSGHGKLARDGSVALVLSDTKENRLHSTGLLDDQLRVLFNASRARKRVIILDCCYSGAVGEEGFKRASDDAVETLAHQIKGTFVLAASTKFQPAMESAESKGSAFTSCLIEGVRTGKAAEKDSGHVTLSRLGEYLAREVPLRSNQQPKFWDFGGVGGTVIAHVPSSYDAAWTEQTLKRLRQMMAREQIDDALFVELQQVLRSPTGIQSQDRLGLIDDLAQRRVRPVPFLRKWQMLAQVASVQERAIGPEPELDLPATDSGPELEEPAPVLEPGALAPLPHLDQASEAPPYQPPDESPVPTEPLESRSIDVVASAGLMDGSWHDEGQPDAEHGTGSVENDSDEPETAAFPQARLLDFMLITLSLFVGLYVMMADIYRPQGSPFFYFVPILLIGLWVRLWKKMEAIISRVFLSLAILGCSYISARLATEDVYSFLEISGAFLFAFSLVLAFQYWRAQGSQGSQA